MKDLLTVYAEATERQRRAMMIMNNCAETRSLVVVALHREGMSQLAIANLLDLAPSTVWRLLHRSIDRPDPVAAGLASPGPGSTPEGPGSE